MSISMTWYFVQSNHSTTEHWHFTFSWGCVNVRFTCMEYFTEYDTTCNELDNVMRIHVWHCRKRRTFYMAIMLLQLSWFDKYIWLRFSRWYQIIVMISGYSSLPKYCIVAKKWNYIVFVKESSLLIPDNLHAFFKWAFSFKRY